MTRAGRIVKVSLWCVCAVWAWSTPNAAEARGRIPIIIGNDQKMTDFDVLPAELKAALPPEFGPNVKFGFNYSRVHLFWMELWTWNGQFVFHNDKELWELTPAILEGLREKLGAEFPAVPWRYRFPLVPCILLGCGALTLASRISFPSNEKRAARLLKDPRYEEAYHVFMDTMQKTMDAGRVPVEQARQRSMDAGVQYLMDHGIDVDTATKNLERIVAAVVDTPGTEAPEE